MLRWIDIKKYSKQGNPKPDQRIEKTEEEWIKQLSDEQYRITRQKGTERAFSNEMCSIFEPGQYACVCCGTLLFDADEKFESGTGWPSFTQPAKENAVAYNGDDSFGMTRIETTCNTCDAHLGHVFPDGPEPSGLRYCINAEALTKVKFDEQTAKAIFGGGCFWCTEAVFQKVKGVSRVVSGYCGGEIVNPTYREICSGRTRHAEVVEVTYNPKEISYQDLVRIHLLTHDPTTLNRQGNDSGTQYRSVIFIKNAEEKKTAEELTSSLNKEVYENKIVTEIAEFEVFYPAEDHHQNYYNENPYEGYCSVIIAPKLQKFREGFKHYLKTD